MNAASAPFNVTCAFAYAVSLMFLARTLGIILTRTQVSIKNIESENTRQGQDVLIEDRLMKYTDKRRTEDRTENRKQDSDRRKYTLQDSEKGHRRKEKTRTGGEYSKGQKGV